MHQTLFDERSRELAEDFLSDWNVVDDPANHAKRDRLCRELASEIQCAIENWLQEAEMRGDIAET